MTQMGVNYLNLQETQRANRAKEGLTRSEQAETRRSNLAREFETNRSNLARELETNRSNLARELETNRSNLANEAIGRRQAGASERQAGAAEMRAANELRGLDIRQQEADASTQRAFNDKLRALEAIGVPSYALSEYLGSTGNTFEDIMNGLGAGIIRFFDSLDLSRIIGG